MFDIPRGARASAVGLLAVLVTSAPTARAQSEVPTELDLPPWARAERSYAGLNVEVWPSTRAFGGDQLALVLEPFVQVMVSEHWALTGSLPLGYHELNQEPVQFVPGPVQSSGSGAKHSTFVLGSVTIGAHYTANLAEDRLNLWAGLRLAVPTMLMRSGDRVATLTGEELAAPTLNGSRAGTHAHRFAVLQLGIRPEMGIAWLIPADWLFLRSTLAPLVLAPVSSTRDVDAGLDHISEIEARAGFGLGGGLAFQEAFMFTPTGKVQTALEPFVAYESPGPGFVARFGVLVGLDQGNTVPVRSSGESPRQNLDGTTDNTASGSLGHPRVVTPRFRVGGTW